MHQALTTDAATVAAAPSSRKKRWSRKKRYIIFGSIGLLLLWIISSIISSKREKPIPITTEKAVRKTIVQTVSDLKETLHHLRFDRPSAALDYFVDYLEQAGETDPDHDREGRAQDDRSNSF